MDYIEERREEVLDGRRSWNKNDHADGDADVFYTQFVLPLQELHRRGLIESVHPRRGSYDGSTRIDRIDIRGSINLDA